MLLGAEEVQSPSAHALSAIATDNLGKALTLLRPAPTCKQG